MTRFEVGDYVQLVRNTAFYDEHLRNTVRQIVAINPPRTEYQFLDDEGESWYAYVEDMHLLKSGSSKPKKSKKNISNFKKFLERRV